MFIGFICLQYHSGTDETQGPNVALETVFQQALILQRKIKKKNK
jgi:hypothetical protein